MPVKLFKSPTNKLFQAETSGYKVAIDARQDDVKFHCSCIDFWVNFGISGYRCKHVNETIREVVKNG